MFIVLFLIFGTLVILGATAVYGFYWSAKTGQFQNLADNSRCIFDEEEPVGNPTDSFPGETWARKTRAPLQRKEVHS